jgi:hypothetical protein
MILYIIMGSLSIITFPLAVYFLWKKYSSKESYKFYSLTLAVVLIYFAASMWFMVLSQNYGGGYFGWYVPVYWLFLFLSFITLIVSYEIKSSRNRKTFNNVGIEAEDYRRQKSNGLIISAFILSLAAWYLHPFPQPMDRLYILPAAISIILVIMSLKNVKHINFISKLVAAISLVISLGIFAGVIVSKLQEPGRLKNNYIQWTKDILGITEHQLEGYKQVKGRYPDNLKLLYQTEQYDYFKTPYHYKVSVDGQSYELYSAGPDKINKTADDIYPASVRP